MTTATTPTHPAAGFAATAIRDLGYLAAVLAWSIVGFAVWVTGTTVTASVLVLVVGVFAWIAFAHTMRWTTAVDRRLAGWLLDEDVPAVYRRPSERGLIAYLKTVTADPQTWREFGWLALNSVAGFTLAVVVWTGAGVALAYTTMPIWFWAISDPAGEHGLTNLGFMTVDTVGEALAAMAAGLVLVPLVALLARAAAAGHARLAARVLGP